MSTNEILESFINIDDTLGYEVVRSPRLILDKYPPSIIVCMTKL